MKAKNHKIIKTGKKNGYYNYTGHRNRLRDKFMAGGLDSFLDHEVLEFLLTYAIPRKDTKPIAWNLVKRFGSLSQVLDAKYEGLRNIKGLGKNSVIYLSFMRALIRRYFLNEIKQKNIIRCPEDVIEYGRASLEGEKDEIFEVIYLTIRNTVITSERIAVGTIDRASVSPRKVVENALKAGATGLVFLHNHPSEISSPSEEDVHLTEELAKAAKTLGLSVHDHIIIGKSDYYSFRANGLLQQIVAK